MRRLERLQRALSPHGAAPVRDGAASEWLEAFLSEIERTLQEIDFDEVTTEDRVTFVECAVAWRVRQALGAGRFDLGVALVRFGERQVAELRAEDDSPNAVPDPIPLVARSNLPTPALPSATLRRASRRLPASRRGS